MKNTFKNHPKHIFIMLLTMMACGYTSAQKSIEGHWEGFIKIQSVELEIKVFLDPNPGKLTSKIDIPAQGAEGLELQNISFQDPKVIFELPSGLGVARFEGEKKDDKIIGEFIQGVNKGTFELSKSGNISHAQTVEINEFYKSEEVSFINGETTLAGTLSIPLKTGKHPAVVLISGSGPQNRDSDVFGFKVFRKIADSLSRNGIAVLRYDDRGVGKSVSKDAANSTTKDYAEDVKKAVEFLRQHKDINPNKIGLLGHS